VWAEPKPDTKDSQNMKLTTIAPLLIASALACATGGCASDHSESTAGDVGALSAGAGVEFTSSVGAVVVAGQKVCTAALVDVDAGAHVGPISAHGRQIVMGGACIGRFKNGLIGGEAFVTQQNGFQVSTPIIALDLQSQASAGLAVGILSDPIPGAEPVPVLGVSALVNAGAHVATVLEADKNGFLVGASAEIHAGVAFSLVTPCAQFSFAAQAGVKAGASLSVGKDGLGAAAFVKVDGKLQFAAHIDQNCHTQDFGNGAAPLSSDTLTAAQQISDMAGGAPVLAVLETPQSLTAVTVTLDKDADAILISGTGHISATDQNRTSCDNNSNGPCELHPAGGYKAGQNLAINIDTHQGGLFSSGGTARVVISEK
jgi:hypothetical protein